MAITDIQISEELQTGAPSIKYRGNEGPKAPMQMADADPLLVEEYEKYVFEMEEQGLQPMSFEEFRRQAIAGYAYGGIAGLDGRKRYGIGSKIKKKIRNIIPNELSKAATVAAPFVAPFNPALAGAMAGIGGFDQHGSISKGLKSGLLTYGGGQLSRYLGGADLQGNPFSMTGGYDGGAGAFRGGMEGFRGGFSKPIGTNERFFDKWFKGDKKVDVDVDVEGDAYSRSLSNPAEKFDTPKQIKAARDAGKGNALHKFLKGMGMNTAAMAGIVGASALAGLYTAKNPADDSIEQMRGSGMDIESIRTEVTEAMKDPTGKLLAELRIKYPFLGAQETKNVGIMAEGGRAGYYEGGQSIPSEYTVEDARKTAMQDRLGGITEVMKQADLYRQGDIGQMYMAEGGSPIMMASNPSPGDELNQMSLMIFKKPLSELTDDEYEDLQEYIREKSAQGGRIGAQEGGIMDLGGMEKDYRETGGFVDLGAKEKADDVPARLSVNEFVMTADAVRGAGDGDIDVGAERMEDLMEKLEAKNKRQQGASDMFEVSERLSAVV
jgi:hypothetical protein